MRRIILLITFMRIVFGFNMKSQEIGPMISNNLIENSTYILGSVILIFVSAYFIFLCSKTKVLGF